MAAGKVRALAVMPGDRNPAYPNVPSMKELGFEIPTPITQYYVLGPKGMDKAVLDKLYKVFAEALRGPALQQFALKNGLTIDVQGPEESAKQIRDNWKLYTKIIQDFKIEVKK